MRSPEWHALVSTGFTGFNFRLKMLAAAHLVLGENLPELLAHLSNQNPAYKFTDPQAEFVHEVARKTALRN